MITWGVGLTRPFSFYKFDVHDSEANNSLALFLTIYYIYNSIYFSPAFIWGPYWEMV